MIRPDLTKLVEKPKGTKVKIRPINARRGSVKAYLKQLRRIRALIAAKAISEIVPRLEQAGKPGHLTDEVQEDWFEKIEEELVILIASIGASARRIFADEERYHRRTFLISIQHKLGIDLKAALRSEDLTDYLDVVATRNAALVQGLSQDAIKALKAETVEAYLQGKTTAEFRRALTARLGFLKSRATLIAEDQLSKVASEINKIRQQQVGITKYEWRTSSDERVRDRHRALHGKTFEWDKPTPAENGLPPGQPIRCRCIPQGVVEW